MKARSSLLAACIGLAFFGCQKKSEEAPAMADEPSYYAAPSAPTESDVSSSKSVGAAADASRAPTPVRQFVRSADLRFRCRSVAQTTSTIERIVAFNGGFVELNDLRSRIEESRVRPFGEDSLLAIRRVEIWNTMVLRVPNDRLDTVLAQMAPLVAFLDHRTIRAQNVTQELRRAERDKRRMERASERMQNLVQNPGKVKDLAQVDDLALDRQTRADAALDRTEGLHEQVELSSVQLALYQHPEPLTDTLQRPLAETWREPFWKQAARGFTEGWEAGLDFALWWISHWVLVVVLIAGFAAFRKFRKFHRANS